MSTTAPELEQLRESFRTVLEVEASRERVRAAIGPEAPIDRALWRTMVELGWTALITPEGNGGLGLGFAEAAALYAEAGRRLAVAPLTPSLLATDAIAAAGDESQKESWLPALAAGEATGSVSALERVTAEWKSEADGVVVSGRVQGLLDGGNAQLFIIFADSASGERCALILTPDDAGVSVAVRRTVDVTRHVADLELNAVRATAERILARGEAALALHERILAHGALAIAQDCVAAADAIFQATLEYLKVRVQFDRPIGSFQALKHRCATHAVALAASKALVDEAWAEWVRRPGAASPQVALAKAYASEVFDTLGDDALQMHGGIGMTWEHDCHLYLKRAKLNRLLFSAPERQFDLAFERATRDLETA